MKLFEFEAKDILKRYGILTPVGKVVSSPAEAESTAAEIGGPVALKSQVLVSGRGKSGGILFASDAQETREIAAKLFGSDIKGSTVANILIEQKIDIVDEFYASVTIDRQAKKYVAMASTSGGIDIEEIARESPEKIARHHVDPIKGLDEHMARKMLAPFTALSASDAITISEIIHKLYRIAMDYDAELIEINPLAKTASEELVACDARIIIDDNALFRHPEFEGTEIARIEASPAEIEARKQGLAYVDLDGDIGIIGNGAGLMMATLDVVHLFGGKPANFLDIGGGAGAETIRKALTIIMSKPKVKAVLINILGGVTRCDLVAQGIIEALDASSVKKPIVVRMMGTKEEEGIHILKGAGINSYSNMEDAIEEVVGI
ncbi:MAG: ADP-forming succinate--CoA ligase subunit beta [Chloroflexota bacterium]|nr:ADP-forming succinate--CoA ligase subunit beta [Chloroflexota bacterium]